MLISNQEISYKYSFKGGGFVWRKFNNNPVGRKKTGDCAVRAVSLALGVNWDTAYAMMVVSGFSLGDMPSGNYVWGDVLYRHGFRKIDTPCTGSHCYTFADIANLYPHGILVLGTGTHVATIIDGILYDAWDSSDEVPQYVWFKPNGKDDL